MWSRDDFGRVGKKVNYQNTRISLCKAEGFPSTRQLSSYPGRCHSRRYVSPVEIPLASCVDNTRRWKTWRSSPSRWSSLVLRGQEQEAFHEIHPQLWSTFRDAEPTWARGQTPSRALTEFMLSRAVDRGKPSPGAKIEGRHGFGWQKPYRCPATATSVPLASLRPAPAKRETCRVFNLASGF